MDGISMRAGLRLLSVVDYPEGSPSDYPPGVLAAWLRRGSSRQFQITPGLTSPFDPLGCASLEQYRAHKVHYRAVNLCSRNPDGHGYKIVYRLVAGGESGKALEVTLV